MEVLLLAWAGGHTSLAGKGTALGWEGAPSRACQHTMKVAVGEFEGTSLHPRNELVFPQQEKVEERREE